MIYFKLNNKAIVRKLHFFKSNLWKISSWISSLWPLIPMT